MVREWRGGDGRWEKRDSNGRKQEGKGVWRGTLGTEGPTDGQTHRRTDGRGMKVRGEERRERR